MIRSATNFKKKQRSTPLNVIGPRLLKHFYIIKSSTSQKIIGYPALRTLMLKTCLILMTSKKG